MTESPIRTSEQTDKIDAAMAAAQIDLENPIKGKTAKIEGQSKKTGRDFAIDYSYADIADILANCRPILAKAGIATYQVPIIAAGGALIIVTRLSCSGQWIEGDYPVCHIGGDHKEMGSALTYARRYALGAMIGIAPEKDDDAATAAHAAAPMAAHNRPADRQERDQRQPPPRVEGDFPGDRPRSEPPKSSGQAKKDGDWERYEAEIKVMRTVPELKAWAKANAAAVKALPKKWFDALQDTYNGRKAELEAAAEEEPAHDPNADMDAEYQERMRDA